MNPMIRGGQYDNSVLVSEPQYWRNCTPSCGAWAYVNSYTNTKSVDSGYFTGVNIPDYHRRKRAGELLPQTPFKKFKVSGSTEGSAFLQIWSGSNHSEYKLDSYNPLATWILTEDNLTPYIPTEDYIQDAMARVYSAGHDTLTFLAELPQVLAMFKTCVPSLVKLLLPTGRANRKLKLKQVASAWLMGRYGWRPLYYDIVSLNEAVKRASPKLERLSKSCGNTTYEGNVTTGTSTLTYEYRDVTTSDAIKVGCRANVVADITVSNFSFNPLVTGWEKVPFSFIVDWVIGVGRFLSAVSFLSTATRYSSSRGYKIIMTRVVQSVNRPRYSYIQLNTGQLATSVAELKVRTPATVPVYPQFRLRLNAYKVMDLVALVVQALTRH